MSLSGGQVLPAHVCTRSTCSQTPNSRRGVLVGPHASSWSGIFRLWILSFLIIAYSNRMLLTFPPMRTDVYSSRYARPSFFSCVLSSCRREYPSIGIKVSLAGNGDMVGIFTGSGTNYIKELGCRGERSIYSGLDPSILQIWVRCYFPFSWSSSLPPFFLLLLLCHSLLELHFHNGSGHRRR